MKISNKLPLVVIILITVALTACGGNLDSPPLVYLEAESGLVDGFQGSYCWDQGRGAAICVDKILPYFDETPRLNLNDPIRFQFDTPLPDQVTISISEELFGDTIVSESMTPAEMIEWSPMVGAGTYIIDVQTTWKQGGVSYFFSVLLE
jgi:hypothetical protein